MKRGHKRLFRPTYHPGIDDPFRHHTRGSSLRKKPAGDQHGVDSAATATEAEINLARGNRFTQTIS